MIVNENELETLRLLVGVANSKLEDFNVSAECGFVLDEEIKDGVVHAGVFNFDYENPDSMLKKLMKTKRKDDKRLIDKRTAVLINNLDRNRISAAKEMFAQIMGLMSTYTSCGIDKFYKKLTLEQRVKMVSTLEEFQRSDYEQKKRDIISGAEEIH